MTVWQIPSVPFSKKVCQGWCVFVKYFDTPANSRKSCFIDKVCFVVKCIMNQRRTWTLKVIAVNCLGKIYFLLREYFSLFRWWSCALVFVADMLSHMGACFETWQSSFRAEDILYLWHRLLPFQPKNKYFFLPFITILTNMRTDHSPNWGPFPRSQEPAVQDSRSKFSCIFKSIQVNYLHFGYNVVKFGR